MSAMGGGTSTSSSSETSAGGGTAMILLALLILFLVTDTGAVPFEDATALCSTECPITGSPKLFYHPGKTYTYEYFMKSLIQLKSVESGMSVTDWSTQVELSWRSPCDMVITLKDSEIHGGNVPDAARFLERYPLVVAVVDGRVQHVCSHPDDDTWSVNIKKGVASAFQNSLPSISTVNSGQSITETDVVGKCLTRYEVYNERNRVIVKKEKNHRLCKERYFTPTETQVPWLRGPLPLEVSESSCIQEIRHGIYSAIICKDRNVVRPSYGAYKYVEAKQESALRYLSESSEESAADFTVSLGNMVRKSLLYSYDTPKKDPSMVTQLDQIITQICEKIKDVVERDVAALVARAVQLLRWVPQETVEQTLVKIRRGQYCQDHKKLENLYLDAVACVQESGAIKVMMMELVRGQVPEGRAALYTAALYLHLRPTWSDIEALVPIFESPRPVSSVILAAASVVNAYCRRHSQCHNEALVRTIAGALNNKILNQCSLLSEKKEQEAALLTLKTIGNMGVMTPTVATSLIRCMKIEGVLTSVRVAAAQAFRQAQCKQSITNQLLRIAVDPTGNTEVRIASYLTVIRCVKQHEMEMIINNITGQENTQVRGFILSHLVNLQDTNTPHKEHLRHMLTNILLPRDFETDIRKYSHNIDLSYFFPSLDIGAGVESNIIYAPGSFVPRSIDFNLTVASGGALVNIGEVGVRIEGLRPIIDKLIGPGGYLRRTSLSNIFRYILMFLEKQLKEIIDNFQDITRQKRTTDMSLIYDFFTDINYYGRDGGVRADIFARYMGQEISFASLSGNLEDIAAIRIGRTVGSFIAEILLQMKNVKTNNARTAGLHLEYSITTIQGTPLKLKFEGTAIVGLELEGNLNLIDLFMNSKREENTTITPSLSIQIDGFIGFDNYLTTTGMKTVNTVSSSNCLSLNAQAKDNEVKILWALPEKMEFIDVKSETYLMKTARGSPETKIIPASMRDIRVSIHSCINSFEPVLGLKLCYDLDIPDIFRSSSLPLGAPSTARIYIEKSEPSITGYNITAHVKKLESSEYILMKIYTCGSSKPTKTEAIFSFSRVEKSFLTSVTFDSLEVSGGVYTIINTSEDYKGVQVFADYRSNENILSRGFKADFRTTSSLNDSEYEANVFISTLRDFPLTSRVIEMKLTKKISLPDTALDLLCGTRNVLRNYFDFNFEASGDLRYTSQSSLPLPLKLRKLDFHTGLGGWQLDSIIRQTRESGENAEHLSTFNVKRWEENLIFVEATHTTQGSLYDNFIIRTAALIKLSQTEYKSSAVMQRGVDTAGVTWQVLGASNTSKIMALEVLHTYSGKSYGVIFMVDIPKYISAIEFESTIGVMEENILLIEVGLTYGSQVILQVYGPVKYEPSSTSVEFNAELRIVTAVTGRHHLSTAVSFANNSEIMSFTLKKHQELVVTVECKAVKITQQETVIAARVLLPGLVDLMTDIITNERFLYITLTGLLSLRNTSPHTLKGYVNIDLHMKSGRVDISWDTDHDPSTRVTIDVTIASVPLHPGQFSLQGLVGYRGMSYPVVLEVSVADLHHTTFTLNIQTPDNKSLVLDFVNAFKINSSVSIDTRVLYKSLRDMQYKLTSFITFEKLDGPFSFSFESQLSFTAPQGHQTSLKTEAKHQLTPEKRIIYFKGSASSPTRKLPLTLELESNSTKKLYDLQWMVDTTFPVTMYNVELMIGPNGAVRVFDSCLNVTAVMEFLDAVVKLLDLEVWYSDEFYEIGSKEIVVYHYRFHRPTLNTFSVIFESPSRSVEGEAEYSPSESSFKFFLDRNRTYRIAAKSSYSQLDQQSKYEGRLSHPRLTKDLGVTLQFSDSVETPRGTIELDIFPDRADKITGALKTRKMTRNTIMFEVLFTSRILENNPKLVVVIARAPHIVGFDAMIHLRSSSPVLFQVSAKYDGTPTGDATVTFHVKNTEGTVMEIAGVVKPELVPDCKGLRIKSVVHTSLIGSYDIHLRLGKPSVFELITESHSSRKVYTTKFDFYTFKNVEAMMSVYDKLHHKEEVIVLSRIKPLSPYMIDVDMTYNERKFKSLKDTVSENWVYVAKTFLEWSAKQYQWVVRQAHHRHINFPPEELSSQVGQLLWDLSDIKSYLSDEITAAYEFLCQNLDTPSVAYIRQVVNRVWGSSAGSNNASPDTQSHPMKRSYTG
nr:vitellogenin-like isoform X1 [Cherax quadricarinatus]